MDRAIKGGRYSCAFPIEWMGSMVRCVCGGSEETEQPVSLATCRQVGATLTGSTQLSVQSGDASNLTGLRSD